MAETAAKRPRRRRWLIALLALLVIAGVVAAMLHRYSRPERITALLVEQARDQLGLELSLGGKAGYALSPRLEAVLPQPELKVQGKLLLRAVSLGASVPWHTLWSDRYEIERVELVQPQLDLDVLRSWLASRPTSSAATPDVRFVLRIADGTIVSSGKPIAKGVDVQLGNSNDLAAWLATFETKAGATTLLPPLGGKVEAAALQLGDTRLEGVRIELRDDAPAAKKP